MHSLSPSFPLLNSQLNPSSPSPLPIPFSSLLSDFQTQMGEMASIPFESLPLGFRFRPTDEELMSHYLKPKISGRINPVDAAVIPEVDVCKHEPWDLPFKSPIRSDDPEWFFFAPKDRKYPNGNRSNRATEAGYWKATGKDRLIKSRPPVSALIGTKKTLVFYRGRAPKGARSNWIMHEYRTVEPEFESGDQGGFVLCRLFKKSEENIPGHVADEMERSGFSPTPTRSSLGETVHGADALEGLATPVSQEFPHPGVQEGLQPKQLNGSSRCLSEKSDCSVAYPQKQEDSHCISNVSSDAGDHEAKTVEEEVGPLLDHLAPFLGEEYEQLGSVGYPHACSPMLPYVDYPLYDNIDQPSHVGLVKDEDDDQDSVDRFLDAVLSFPEECSPAVFQSASATEVVAEGEMKNGSAWDSVSAKDGGISNDAQALVAQGGLGLETSGQFCWPSLLLSDSSKMDTDGRYPEMKPQFYNLCETETPMQTRPLPSVESARLKSKLESDGASTLPGLFNSTEESVSQSLSVGSGIKIRSWRQNVASSSNFATQQGMAPRRIRLVSSVHVGSAASRDSDMGTEKNKAGEHDKHKISEETQIPVPALRGNHEGCFSDHDDTASTEVRTSFSETSEESKSLLRLTPQPINDIEVKLKGSLHSQLTPRLSPLPFSRIALLVSVVLLPLSLGISWFLRS